MKPRLEIRDGKLLYQGEEVATLSTTATATMLGQLSDHLHDLQETSEHVCPDCEMAWQQAR